MSIACFYLEHEREHLVSSSVHQRRWGNLRITMRTRERNSGSIIQSQLGSRYRGVGMYKMDLPQPHTGIHHQSLHSTVLTDRCPRNLFSSMPSPLTQKASLLPYESCTRRVRKAQKSSIPLPTPASSVILMGTDSTNFSQECVGAQ